MEERGETRSHLMSPSKHLGRAGVRRSEALRRGHPGGEEEIRGHISHKYTQTTISVLVSHRQGCSSGSMQTTVWVWSSPRWELIASKKRKKKVPLRVRAGGQ
ncbi:unnamed protein product [Pleuronectes platessa]|uniref:Uncharacterized protein n=1 Tax=Pleuronectes platessa TaxID=8262 RepID=A0A9N7TU52_PLEPL|nr:unnamed protein product [Pleuronectes platessa]